MSRKNSLTKKSPIYQYLFQLGFFLHFSKPILQHIETFIKSSVQKGYKGTITDIVYLSFANCHRTTYGKFLSQGLFNTNYAWKCIRMFVIKLIIASDSKDDPIFAIYDDTLAEKTKPSSQATNFIKSY